MQFLVLVIVQIFRQDFFHYVFVLIDRHDRCIEVKTKSAYYRKNGKIVEKFGDSKYYYQIQNCNHYLLHATKGNRGKSERTHVLTMEDSEINLVEFN